MNFNMKKVDFVSETIRNVMNFEANVSYLQKINVPELVLSRKLYVQKSNFVNKL